MTTYQRVIPGGPAVKTNDSATTQRVIPGGPLLIQRAGVTPPTPGSGSEIWHLLTIRRGTR